MNLGFDASKAKRLGYRLVLGTILLVGSLIAIGYFLERFLPDSLPMYVTNIISSILLVLSAILFVKISSFVLRRISKRESITDHQEEISFRVIQISVYITLCIVLVSSVWEVNLGNILIGAGVLGVVIGFAAQKLLSSVFSGIIIMATDMYRIGDWVQFGEKFGRVKQITFFNTKMRSPQGEQHIIPNDTVTATDITNLSQTRYRNDLLIGVDYQDDAERAIDICDRVVQDLSEVPHNNIVEAQPTSIKSFDDSSVTLSVKVWLKNPSPSVINQSQTDVFLEIKSAFEEEGLTIPFPQQTISFKEGASRNQFSDEPSD
jgi:small-conductance mechanosensitive channel